MPNQLTIVKQEIGNSLHGGFYFSLIRAQCLSAFMTTSGAIFSNALLKFVDTASSYAWIFHLRYVSLRWENDLLNLCSRGGGRAGSGS